MKNKIYVMYCKYKINSLYKRIRNVELNIYFDKWTGQDCIDYNYYCCSKIKELKVKLKKYEK